MILKLTLLTAVVLLLLVACTAPQTEPAAQAPTATAILSVPPTPASTAVDAAPTSGVQIIASGTIIPPTASPIDLPDLGPAPELLNTTWINSDGPVTLESVRGKVVLLEFWTFGCINCVHVIPHVRDWYARYNGDNFTVISIHYPEFQYEENYDNVVAATKELEILYPVALDNDGTTWNAYKQRFWPTTYLIDKQGHIRYQQIGEGAYQRTDAAIQQLMAEPES